MQIEVILKRFGLSEKEILVYLALIEAGPSPVRNIALKSKVNRGTTYDILKSLINLGIVAYYNKESKQYFVAEPPENLLAAIEHKKQELDEISADVSQELPFLKTLFQKQGGRPVVKFYEGNSGIKQILEDVIFEVASGENKEYYLYSAATEDQRKSMYMAMPQFSEKRVKKGINVKIISLGEGGKLAGLDERKWLKAEEGELKNTHEIIYAGKVAHLSLGENSNPVGVVIQNEGIFQTQRKIFEGLWEKL